MQPFLKDARYFQIIFQVVFLGYGIVSLHWMAEWKNYAVYFVIAICTQLFCEMVLKKINTKRVTNGWFAQLKAGIPSALITAFGLSLLLKTDHIEAAALAAFISIASKYLIRINGKHIFNPSALGIVATIALTGHAWINTGQWGSNVVLFFGIICLGLIVVTRVQKLDCSIAFLGSFAVLLFFRQVVFLGWPIDFFVQSITTGGLLLFSFFMISDPRTTPNHPVVRIAWAMGVAIISFYLTTFHFMNGAPVWVLVLAQPFVPVLDKLFKEKPFEWVTNNAKPAAGFAVRKDNYVLAS